MNQETLLGTDETALIPPSSDEKTMAILSHILALFTSFVGPLVIYLVKKDSTFITAHAKESLNFQLTLMILFIVSFFLWLIIIGILVTWALGIANLVLIIIATVKANEGKLYKYPFSIKFVK